MFVFMKVAATYAAPLDCYEGFVGFWCWLWYVDNADVSCGKELGCFHHDVGDKSLPLKRRKKGREIKKSRKIVMKLA